MKAASQSGVKPEAFISSTSFVTSQWSAQFPFHDRRITEDMPLRVGLGTRGSFSWLFVSCSLVVGPRRRL